MEAWALAHGKATTTIESINPATGKAIRSYVEMDERGIEGCLRRAEEGFRAWRERPIDERTGLLREAARLLRMKTVWVG